MVRIPVRNFHDSSSGMPTDLRSSDEEVFVEGGHEQSGELPCFD